MKVRLTWEEWFPWHSIDDNPNHSDLTVKYDFTIVVDADSEMVKRLDFLHKEAIEVQGYFDSLPTEKL